MERIADQYEIVLGHELYEEIKESQKEEWSIPEDVDPEQADVSEMVEPVADDCDIRMDVLYQNNIEAEGELGRFLDAYDGSGIPAEYGGYDFYLGVEGDWRKLFFRTYVEGREEMVFEVHSVRVID